MVPEKLKEVTSRRGGVVMGAAGGLLKALGAGTNPVWGAVKGAIGGLSTKAKVLIVLALPRLAAGARCARRGTAGAARVRRSGRGANPGVNLMPAPAA